MTDVRLLTPRDVRELADALGVSPTKRLGQNFVIDPNTVRRIVHLAGLSPRDVVLEVGPGLGSLTLGLLPAVAQVVAVEIDDTLAAQLPLTVERFGPDCRSRLTVINSDAMTVDLSVFAPTAFVANLPYNIAVPVTLQTLAACSSIETGVLMVQLEVAQRLAATVGDREYGIPSVKMQWFGGVETVGRVGPNVFWPVPRVDSGLVRFRRGTPPASQSGREAVFACIDAGFSQRRKKLRSALAAWAGSVSHADEVLASAGVEPGARAENLTLLDFIRIADARHRVETT